MQGGWLWSTFCKSWYCSGTTRLASKVSYHHAYSSGDRSNIWLQWWLRDVWVFCFNVADTLKVTSSIVPRHCEFLCARFDLFMVQARSVCDTSISTWSWGSAFSRFFVSSHCSWRTSVSNREALHLLILIFVGQHTTKQIIISLWITYQHCQLISVHSRQDWVLQCSQSDHCSVFLAHSRFLSECFQKDAFLRHYSWLDNLQCKLRVSLHSKSCERVVNMLKVYILL